MAGRKSFFLFLMSLAWKSRYSMPLLLSGTVALLGQAWMFQIRVHTVHRLRESELFSAEQHSELVVTYSQTDFTDQFNVIDDSKLAYYDENGEDNDSWETESTDSWETIVEEVAYG